MTAGAIPGWRAVLLVVAGAALLAGLIAIHHVSIMGDSPGAPNAGQAMSQTELQNGADPEANQLAQTIIDTQQGEITEMETMLQQL
jgi:hypothetical protein